MLFHHTLLDPLIALSEKKTTVFYDKEKSFSAEKLWHDAQQLAVELSSHGIKNNDRIVLAFEGGVEFLTVMYACILLRVKVSIIDPEMGRDLYAVKLKQFDPHWAFVDSRLLLLQEHPLVRFLYFKFSRKAIYFPKKKGVRVIAMGKWFPLLQKVTWFNRMSFATQHAATITRSDADHDFLIVYTSGTLQEPKGVVLSLDALAESIRQLTHVLKASPGDRIATYLPHFLLLGIASSVPVYYFNPNLTPENKFKFFREQKITTIFGPPSDFLPLIKYCEANQTKLPATLQHILLGSAPVHSTFIKRLLDVCDENIRLTCTYGMTENLLVSTISGRDKINYQGEGDPVGSPVEGIEIKILEDGEIALRSKQMYSHYFHLTHREDFHLTGDLGYRDGNGDLFLKGRKKEMIIRRNMNIYPALYESTIKKIPGIDEAALVGIFNAEKQDEDLILAVEGRKDLSEKFVMEKLSYGANQIDKEALPDRIVFMEIPRKGRQNKIDRNEIIKRIKG